MHPLQELGDWLGDGERVLHDGADVVIDVDDNREFVTVGEPHAQHQVVAVAQDVHHLGGAVHLEVGEARQPTGQLVTPVVELSADACPLELVGDHGDHGDEGRGLATLDVEERLDELLEPGR